MPNFLKYIDHRQNVPKFLKTRFFRDILNNPASTYACSCSHLFRTTTGIQLGPDAFDKRRLVMIFLRNLVLEKKVSKGMIQSSRLQFFEIFLTKIFPLSDAEDRIAVNYSICSRFTFVKYNFTKSLKVVNSKLFCNDFFAMITSHSSIL